MNPKAQLFSLLILSAINLSTGLLHCKCNDHHKCLINNQGILGNISNFYCTIEEKGQCFAARVIDFIHPFEIKIVQRYGCLSTDSKSILSCKGHYFNSTRPVAIGCCNKTNFCNSELHPKFYHYESDQHVINFVKSHLDVTTSSKKKSADTVYHISFGTIMSAVCVSLLIICVTVCVAVVCYCRQRLHLASKHVFGVGGASRMCGVQENALLPVHPHSNTAASGSLMTASSMLTTTMTNLSHYRLTQRTIGHQILFTQLLGKGRFSEVWAGDWLGELVAIKHLYQSGRLKMLHETLWLRTIALYYSYPVQHNHVVSLLGSDKIPHDVVIPCSLTLVLIYPYYHWGTLARMMASSHWDLTVQPSQSTQVNSRLETLSRMTLSLVSGLCYLHTEIAATKGKPAIAHRNLKSGNVYVKDDYSCCIGDLEWALVDTGKDDDRTNLESQIMPPTNVPNGLVKLPDFEYYVTNVLLSSDCRYVAPELLVNNGTESGSVRGQCATSVEEYKKCDVYSLSLILWELLVWFEPRLKKHDVQVPLPEEQCLLTTSNYEPAYQMELIALRKSLSCDPVHLFTDPRPSEMRHLLLTQSLRPSIDIQRISHVEPPEPPTDNPSSTVGIIELLCQIIPQCWCPLPNSRLSCLKIKKYLSQLSNACSGPTETSYTVQSISMSP